MPTLFQAYGLADPTPEATPAPEPKRTVLGTMGDIGLSLAGKLPLAVAESGVGLADLITQGRAGKALEDAGVRFREANQFLDEQYSDAQKAANQKVEQADGFVDTAAAALQNPSVIGHSVLQSLGLMGGGWAAARGAMKVLPKLGAAAAGAVGEGTIGAGSAAESIRQQTPDGLLTGEQAALAGASGLATGALGFGGAKFAQSKLGQKLGIADIDTWMAGAAKNPAISAALTKRVLGGMVSEGTIEELPQSISEQVFQNLALGKPLDEGVDQAAVLGWLSGTAMGGGFNAFQGGRQPGQQEAAGAPIPPAGSDVPPPAPAEAGGILSPRGDPLAGNPGFDVNRTLVERGREADQDRRLDEGLDAAGFDARQRLQDELQGQRVWPVKQMERQLREEAKPDLDTVDALMKAGNKSAADALKKSIDKKIAAKLSDLEVQALSSVDPRWGGKDFATLYMERRREGANQGDAAGHAATLAATLQLAKHAGMSDKAIAATYQKARGLELDEIPDFVERAMQGLADRGIGKPMQGIAQALAGYRDEAILAAGNALLKEQEPAPAAAAQAAPALASSAAAPQPATTEPVSDQPLPEPLNAALEKAVAAAAPGTEAAAAPAPVPEAVGAQPAVRLEDDGADRQDGAAQQQDGALSEPTAAAEADAAWEAAKASGDSARLQQAAAWVRKFAQPEPEPAAKQKPEPSPEPAAPKSTPRPDGTLKIEGDPKALKDQLKAAGVDRVMTAKDGVVVGKSQVDKAKKAMAVTAATPVARAADSAPLKKQTPASMSGEQAEPDSIRPIAGAAPLDGGDAIVADDARESKAVPSQPPAPEAAAEGGKDAEPAQKRDAVTLAREIASARPDDDFTAVREAARKAIVDELGQKALDAMDKGTMMTSDELTRAVHDGQYEGIRAYAAAMPVPVHESDIPREAANAAHQGTSFSSERRGQSEQRDYVRTMVDAWKRAERATKGDPEALARVVEVMRDLVPGYRSRVLAQLAASSRIMSSMIAGPAKFPVERMRKANATADKRAGEANEYLRKGIVRMIRAARAPIDNSPDSELARVKANLQAREKQQEIMKAVNAAIRKKDDAGLKALGLTDEQIADLKKPDFAGRVGVPDYRLKNNNAEIRRLRERLKSAEQRTEEAAAGPVQRKYNGVRIEENATDDRIRLFFDGKPSEEVRNDLKANAFKWSPTAGAWQRQLTDNARRAAQTVLAKHYGSGEATQFSLRDQDEDSSLSYEEVEKIVDELTAKWQNRPDIRVLDSMSEAPPVVLKQYLAQRSQGTHSRVHGFHLKGTVYIVADEMTSRELVQEVLFHEALGHHGLRGWLGDMLRPMLADVILGQREKVIAKAKAYGLDMNKQADRLMAAEEVLAELAATRPELGVIRRLVAAIRSWLRDNIPSFAKMKMTDDELIRKFIIPARGFVERGQSPRPTFTIMGDEGPETVFHIAYHGSPHEFDKFSLDKIGTGEGAQAYGWGLYFAGRREVADYYRESLSPRGPATLEKALGVPMDEADALWAAARVKTGEVKSEMSAERLLFARSASLRKLSDAERATLLARAVEVMQAKRGKLYEVEIPEEGSYLLWDEPLSKQPEAVRKALDAAAEGLYLDAVAKHAGMTRKEFDALGQGDRDAWGDDFEVAATRRAAGAPKYPPQTRSGASGEDYYRDLVGYLGSQKAASEALHAAGVPGIKYMDGASRNRPLRELKREFLKELPQDADFDEVTDLFGTGTFSPANEAILKELQANDWLGFDYPAQAVSAALGGELANFDASDALKQAVADAQQGATFNYVVFDDSAVEIRAQFSLRADTAPDYLKAARQAVADSITAPGTISWWSKTVGTPYHLAQKHPEFKRVFDRVQDFLGDVSAFATEAADRAPTILPKLETWKDILKTAISAEDTKAVGRPVWEGTLMWVRGEDGKPVALSEKEAEAQGMKADEKAQEMLRRGLLRENVLKMWQGLPLEQFQANVETRYRNVALKAGIVWTDAELKSMFNLDARQIGLYREFRAAVDHSITQLALSDMLRYAGKDADEGIRRQVLDSGDLKEASEMLRDHLIDRAKEDPDRNDLLLETSERVIAKADQARDLIDAGYAPLMRFGQYTVDVVDEGGNRLYFGLFETRSEAAAMARHMQEEYPKAAIRRGTVSNEEYKLFAGVSPETLELFGEMLGMESTGDAAKDKAFQEYLKLAKTNRSAMRRLIHRKGIAGFSEDVGRVLAGFVYSNARQSSANLHMGEIGDAANAIPQGQGQLKDQAVKLAEYVKNPQEEAHGIRGLLFAQYLGGSLAAAMVNMTQPVQVTMPYLSQFGGIKQSASQMKRALADVWKKSTGDAELDAALDRRVKDGTVAPQEVHYLMGQSQGRGSLKAGDGTRIGQAKAIANNSGSRLALAWGKFFSAAELFNRRVTYIAAYRIAKAQKMADPDAFAVKAVQDTQFVMNKGNRPNWARGAVGSVLFTFKSYSVNYLELMQRMYASGPEGKKAALFGMAMLLLMGGAGGVPFAEDVSDVIDGIGQRMGYNFSVKRARQQLLRDVLGEALGDFAEKGVSGLPGAPIDVSGRLGMSNLIPGTGILTKKPDHTRDVLEVVGPAGDFAQRVARGVDLFGQGRPLSAALEASPTAARNLAQSWEMATTGEYRDRMGRKVLETDTADAVAKAVGFQPGAVAKVQDASRDAQALVNVARLRESEIAAAWAKAIVDKDEDGRQKAREAVAEWNRKNPDTPIKISLGQVMRRVQNMRMSKAERLEKSAPKEIRQAARREMEQAR